MGNLFNRIVAALPILPSASVATPWRESPTEAAVFRQAGVEGAFVSLQERSGELRGKNRQRAE